MRLVRNQEPVVVSDRDCHALVRSREGDLTSGELDGILPHRRAGQHLQQRVIRGAVFDRDVADERRSLVHGVFERSAGNGDRLIRDRCLTQIAEVHGRVLVAIGERIDARPGHRIEARVFSTRRNDT